MSYKDRLIALHLLPLMCYFELADVLFFVNLFKSVCDRFNIFQYVSIIKISLVHIYSVNNKQRHFYFARLLEPTTFHRPKLLQLIY